MRFSIRDVLWLTVVVALATAWYLDNRSKQKSLQKQTDLLAIQQAYGRAMEVEADRFAAMLFEQRREDNKLRQGGAN